MHCVENVTMLSKYPFSQCEHGHFKNKNGVERLLNKSKGAEPPPQFAI